MNRETKEYNQTLPLTYQEISNLIAVTIDRVLTEAENKIWHAHPVWFLNGNPIVGYSIQKKGLRLMFWSGTDFGEKDLNTRGKKFKDSSIFYNSVAEVDEIKLERWLDKSKNIQWDYKNIVKRKGRLERLE
ncbi:MAG: DUF1801 domain-containing protein [Saprospiraceae bacterium]|nr:DUF1801 domain-containing protein [Saprospiraceae bacterium]